MVNLTGTDAWSGIQTQKLIPHLIRAHDEALSLNLLGICAVKTGDWALIISICSFGVSLAAFVWGVWSHFIYPKPKVSVDIGMKVVITQGVVTDECIALSATNFGPGEVTLHAAILRSWKGWRLRRRSRRYDWGMINPLDGFPYITDKSKGPFSGGLPKKVTLGENFACYFPPVVDWFDERAVADIGFIDTFGRHHWAPRSQIREVQLAVLKKKAARREST